jgi:regulator of sigma E protease
MITLVAFLVTLAVLIAVHEWGHFQVARWCGVKVLRFSIGFGPVVWRRQRSADDTEFALSAIPLGGYVKMLDSREAAVPEAQRPLAFDQKRLWQRSAIVSAGPIANLLLAVLLYAASHWIGVEELRPVMAEPVPDSVVQRAGLRSADVVQALTRVSSDELDAQPQWQSVESLNDVYWHVMQAATHQQVLRMQVGDAKGGNVRELVLRLDDDAVQVDEGLIGRLGFSGPFTAPVLGEVVGGGPADAAGLRAGDRVLSVDGRSVQDGQQLRRWIRQANQPSSAPMQWTVQRDGRPLDVSVVPRVVSDGAQKVGRINAVVGARPEQVLVQQGPIDGLVRGAERTWEVAWLSLKMFGRMLIGEASLKNISGPLTIADVAGQSAQHGLAYYLGFLALVSVGLGVLNLLPVPMLDGGHLMYHLFEAITGRAPSDIWLERLQRVGAFLLFVLIGVALHNDVLRLFG